MAQSDKPANEAGKKPNAKQAKDAKLKAIGVYTKVDAEGRGAHVGYGLEFGGKSLVGLRVGKKHIPIVGQATEIAAQADEFAEQAADIAPQAVEAAQIGRREAKAAQTRSDLIHAAAQVIAEKGYEGTSVADIANAAGYTKGALYSQFDSKESLFLTAVHELNNATLALRRQTDGKLDDWKIGNNSLAGIMIPLEAYLYALRHPESRETLAQTAQDSIASLAAEVHEYHQSETGGAVTQGDIDTAVGLAAIYIFGEILNAIMPDFGIREIAERLSERLAAGAHENQS